MNNLISRAYSAWRILTLRLSLVTSGMVFAKMVKFW